MTLMQLPGFLMPREGIWLLVGAIGVLFVTAFKVSAVIYTEGRSKLESHLDATTLVVLAHGLTGLKETRLLLALIRRHLPNADLLTFNYSFNAVSNLDVYQLTSQIEQAITAAYKDRGYEKIILVGHSAGAVFLRKALVWAAGYADDRPAGTAGLPEEWTRHVDRLIGIAGLNRGWSLVWRDKPISFVKWFGLCVVSRMCRFTRTGRLMLALQRGAPYIADLRVQWIRFARPHNASEGTVRAPFTLHLLGDEDDVVSKEDSKEDSKDIGVAKHICFITLQNTHHTDIITRMSEDPTAPVESRNRYAKIVSALTAPSVAIQCDRDPAPSPDCAESVERIVFVMHGMRDYGDWARKLAERIGTTCEGGRKVVAIPSGYGYFPMGPFLMYWDRQRNVRWFMDQYTEQLANFPAQHVDFVGHSNGTYLLASALRRYSTLRVRNVYFAGSVVPQRYKWDNLIRDGRVGQVNNLVATGDWVVAFFPRFFEQIAEWLHLEPTVGFFDIGAAGFRGFRAGADPFGRVRNFEYVPGGHGTAVQVTDEAKLAALESYILGDNVDSLNSMRKAHDVNGTISFFSNVCWLVWLFLAGILTVIGYLFSLLGWMWLAGYLLVLLALLNSV